MFRLKAKQASPFLPYGRQQIDQSDIDAVSDVLRSDWLTTGPAVAAFEDKLSRAIDAKHAIACSSGTAALHLASLAIGLGPGKTVIVPTITFAATANAPRLAGADIIFADVDGETGLMTPRTLQEAISRCPNQKPDAIFNVALAGQCSELEQIKTIADSVSAPIVEDACHAIGGAYEDRSGIQHRVGENAFSDLTVFSFHPVKTIAMGEGGAVTTQSGRKARAVRQLLNHGIERDGHRFEQSDLAFSPEGEPNPWYYEMQELGLNYRASDIHCALAASQMARLDLFVEKRRQLMGFYRENLKPLGPAVRPLTDVGRQSPAWHLCVTLIDFEDVGKSRATVMQELLAQGIGSQVHYIPVHLQPYYARLSMGNEDACFDGANSYYSRCLSLPLFVDMEVDDVVRVCETLARVLCV
jgi:UDP-4-amino-4,6-dideoxy-N-acetyl-beta-L-altrosamine transaminase